MGEDDFDSINNGDEEEEELGNLEEEEEEDICSLEKDVMKHMMKYPFFLLQNSHNPLNFVEWTLQRLFPTLVL